MNISRVTLAFVCLLPLFAAVDAQGQINNLTREQLRRSDILIAGSHPGQNGNSGRCINLNLRA